MYACVRMHVMHACILVGMLVFARSRLGGSALQTPLLSSCGSVSSHACLRARSTVFMFSCMHVCICVCACLHACLCVVHAWMLCMYMHACYAWVHPHTLFCTPPPSGAPSACYRKRVRTYDKMYACTYAWMLAGMLVSPRRPIGLLRPPEQPLSSSGSVWSHACMHVSSYVMFCMLICVCACAHACVSCHACIRMLVMRACLLACWRAPDLLLGGSAPQAPPFAQLRQSIIAWKYARMLKCIYVCMHVCVCVCAHACVSVRNSCMDAMHAYVCRLCIHALWDVGAPQTPYWGVPPPEHPFSSYGACMHACMYVSMYVYVYMYL